ncbi:MAG: hypothetical protein ACR2J8_14220, partial [Thermomicrobiales bacterium]
MDERRFEAALRALQAGTTRRTGVAAAIGALIGGAGREVAAKHGPAQRDRRHGAGKDASARQAPHGPCGDGSVPENT